MNVLNSANGTQSCSRGYAGPQYHSNNSTLYPKLCPNIASITTHLPQPSIDPKGPGEHPQVQAPRPCTTFETKDVGISTRRGAKCACPLSRARGVRKVCTTCDGGGVSESDGSLVLPEILRPAPCEGISSRLIVPRGVASELFLSTLQCWL